MFKNWNQNRKKILPLTALLGGGLLAALLMFHSINASAQAGDFSLDRVLSFSGLLAVTDTATPTVVPSSTATPTNTATVQPTATFTATATFTKTPTTAPSATPTMTPSLTPTVLPSATATLTPVVTITPTVSPCQEEEDDDAEDSHVSATPGVSGSLTGDDDCEHEGPRVTSTPRATQLVPCNINGRNNSSPKSGLDQRNNGNGNCNGHSDDGKSKGNSDDGKSKGNSQGGSGSKHNGRDH